MGERGIVALDRAASAQSSTAAGSGRSGPTPNSTSKTSRFLDQEMNSLLAAFGMEDGENPPAWYIAATAPAKPNQRVQSISTPQVVEVWA